MVAVVPFPERELTARGVHLNPGKAVALDTQGHVTAPEEISLLTRVGSRITDETGIKVMGIPINTDGFGIESTIGIV